MKTSLKMAALLMALMFAVQGCAVFIGDDHFRHRHFRHRGWHSSLEQSNQPMTQNQLAKNVIDQQQVDKGATD